MLRWLRGQTAGTQLAENDGWETSGAAEPGHGLGRVAGRKSTVARRLSRALRTSWAPPVVGGRAGDPLEGAHPGWSQPFEAPLCLPRPQTFGAFRCPGTRVLSLAALPDGRIVCGCDDGALLFVLLSCSPHSRAADSEAQGVHDASVQGQSGLEEAGRCSVANSTIVRLHSAGVTSLQLLPSLRGPCLLASASWDGTVRIWDVSNLGASTCLHVLHLDDATHDAPPAGVRYGLRSVSAATCLAFDPARGALWGGSSTGSITIWSVKCGEVVGLVTQAHDGDVSCTLALQVCDAVASAGADSMIRIWGASCHECLITLMGHTGPVEALGVCAHSMRLFSTSSSDSTIRAWALANEKLDQGFGEEQLEHDCAQTPHDEDVRDRDKGKWWRFWSWGQEDRPETGYGQTTAPGRQACSDAEKQEHGCASREERRRETTCGPLSTLPGHILDLTNPTSLGYITVKEACSAGEGVHGQGGRSDANLRGPPPILDYWAQFGASSSRTGCGGRGSGVHGKENKEPNTEQHWHIRMDTSIEELMSVRYISFPTSTEPGNEFDRQKAQQIPGKVGPHMSMTASTCDKEDLCRVQTGQAEGFQFDATSLERRLPALPAPKKDDTRLRKGAYARMPGVQQLMPELRRAAARCMLVADARIYIVDQFVLPCIDESRADGNAECAVCQAEGRSFLECVSVSETELAYSRTVNSLPHLDLVSLMERGAERGRGRDVGWWENGPDVGDVTCMALLKDDHEPLRDVVLTGSWDGWVHFWSHGPL